MTGKSTKVLNGQGSMRALAVLCTAVMLTTVGLLRAGTGDVDLASGWYAAGTNITAIATPEQFSKFDGWSGDTNDAFIVNEQITLDVTNAMMVTASFSEKLTISNSVPWRWLAAQDITWTNDVEWAVTNDWDKDGYSTGEEYWSGTDPKAYTSYLHIAEALVQGSDIKLVWHHAKIDGTLPDICVQSSPDLSPESWENVATNQPTNGVNFWVDGLQQRMFYRLCVTNMP